MGGSSEGRARGHPTIRRKRGEIGPFLEYKKERRVRTFKMGELRSGQLLQ